MTAETSQTLDRGLRALHALAATPAGLTMTELAAQLDVSRPVAYRLVATLAAHGYVRRSADGRARLGFAVLHLAARVQPLLRTAALPALRALAEDVGATAHLTVVDAGDALAVAVVEPSWTELHVAYRVGTRHALGKGAAGRAILAARRARRAPPGDRQGADGGADPAYVTSVGELQPGAHGIAAALPWPEQPEQPEQPDDAVPAVEASVGVVALGELDPAVVGPRVVAAARAVARALA